MPSCKVTNQRLGKHRAGAKRVSFMIGQMLMCLFWRVYNGLNEQHIFIYLFGFYPQDSEALLSPA